MALTKLANYLSELLSLTRGGQTAFGETAIAAKDILASSTTDLPPNQRFAMIRDNVHLEPDQFDDEVTYNSPLYEMSNVANQEIIMRTRERNTYFPGAESVSGTSFKVLSDIPDGQFLPDGAVLESGYGGLATGTVTGTPLEQDQDKDKDGPFLHIEDNTADVRIYKSDADGDVPEKKIDHTDWDVDIFNDDRYQWLPDQFSLFRWVFDLYGAGDATLFGRLADIDGVSHYVEIVTIGIRGDPLLDVFDMPASSRLETDGTAVDWAIGPISFFNLTSGEPSFRNKTATYRNTSVTDASIDNTEADVLRVYRMHPDRVEATTYVNEIRAVSPNGDYRAETREVHPNHLTWPSGFNEHNPDNWEAPDNQRARDTSVQEAKVDPGQVTIDTFTDTDGKDKMRGKQDAVAFAVGGGGGKSSLAGSALDRTTMSELDYVVLLGRIAGNNDPNLEEVIWRQRW